MATNVNLKGVFDDYTTWVHDNKLQSDANVAARGRYTAGYQTQIDKAADSSAFEAQASSLGYDTNSDYYTRGMAGIQSNVDSITAERDAGYSAYDKLDTLYKQDLADIKSGGTYGLLADPAPSNGYYVSGTNDVQVEEYTQYVGRHNQYKTTGDSRYAYAYNPYAEYTMDGKKTPNRPNVSVSTAESFMSMEDYYTRVLGAPTIDPTTGNRLAQEESTRVYNEQQRAAAEASSEASGEATKYAGQATKGGGAQFEQTVPVEMETEEEIMGWWS